MFRLTKGFGGVGNPDRVTVILAAAGAALTLGEQHPATVALSRASETMDKIDLWQARLAMKALRRATSARRCATAPGVRSGRSRW